MSVESILVDARNYAQMQDRIMAEIHEAPFCGLDCETEDSHRHEGLNRFCGYDANGFKHGKNKLVFDVNRTTMTGFSVYPENNDTAYYINLAHKDIENRLPQSVVAEILSAKKPGAYWVAHNSPYEITMFHQCHGINLTEIVCTLQMAVSAFGPDEYDPASFTNCGLGGIKSLRRDIIEAFAAYDGGREFNQQQGMVFGQIASKTSKAAHSYNGIVNDLAFGYGLKRLVKSLYGVDMQTFEQTLGDKPHMGELTGEEAGVPYGCEDAVYCMKLFRSLLQMMAEGNPAVIKTFFEQENPMAQVYSEVWRDGFKVDLEQVQSRREIERHNNAEFLRKLKNLVRKQLPFPGEPNEKLMKYESWYKKNHIRYRQMWMDWALSPDSPDDFEQNQQVRGPVSNAWASEKGVKESSGMNMMHYMPARTLFYDLLGLKVITLKGKVQSDADCRAKLIEKAEGGTKEILMLISEMASLDTTMKLYLNPYLDLTDPETGRVYPVLNSMLATRRMATKFPNPMQLAKRGESTYVRGFYLPDQKDHVLMSADWSSVELVIIGDLSRDPEFAKVFGQLPYGDLHSGAAADGLGIPEGQFMDMRSMEQAEEFFAKHGTDHGFKFENFGGQKLAPNKFYKLMRTEVGKGSNFNYWYSGALGTVGEKLGWTSDEMWDATDRYRQRFSVAEEWRLATIAHGVRYGYVELPDGHRRVKYEATDQWAAHWCRQWDALFPDMQGPRNFGRKLMKTIQTRAKNQMVNAKVQGTGGTLAKRSILRLRELVREKYVVQVRPRFKIPVHDELVFSVHKDYVLEFRQLLLDIMCDHPDIIQTLPLHATVSIGNTFEPYHPEKVPYGQIELNEAPVIEGVIPLEFKDKELDEKHIQNVVDYLMEAA